MSVHPSLVWAYKVISIWLTLVNRYYSVATTSVTVVDDEEEATAMEA